MSPSAPEEIRGRPLRVGLVGCGWIAELAHLPALAGSPYATLAAVAEPDRARREWLRTRHPGVPTPPLESLLESEDVDAVVVAAPSALHAEVAEAAFGAGKHVYVEKPLAVGMDGGRRVVRAWEASGRVGMVGYNFRRSPVVEHARAVLDGGEIGALREIQTAFLWAAERVEGWRADPEAGGGALPDLGSHHIDLVTALTGRSVHSVQCDLRSVRTPEDSAALTLTLDDGTRVQTLASYVTGVQVNRVELFGATGSVLVDLLDPLPNPVLRKPGPGARLGRARRAAARLHPRRLLHPPGREPSFRLSLEAFLGAAARGGSVSPTPQEGLYALAVTEAARLSARRGGTGVEIDEVLGGAP